jgi:hypothetical protein
LFCIYRQNKQFKGVRAMTILRLISISILFIMIALVTIGGCGGGGGDGGEPVNGGGNGNGQNLITIAEITFAGPGRFGLDNLSFNPLLTFDEPEFSPPGPIDGKTVQGVTFSFTVDGVQSNDAAVGLSTGPGTTPLVTPPIIEGDAAGLLALIFEPPVNSVSFDFGLDPLLEDVADAATINIFDANDNLLGTASADAIVPVGFLFPEGTLGINSDGQKLITCNEFLETFCDRAVECDTFTFEECLLLVDLFVSAFDCSDVTELSTINECIDDLADFNCEDLNNGLGPDSCSPSEGICDVCEQDGDCADGLICLECVEDCTGVVNRCGSFFFEQECVDGIF